MEQSYLKVFMYGFYQPRSNLFLPIFVSLAPNRDSAKHPWSITSAWTLESLCTRQRFLIFRLYLESVPGRINLSSPFRLLTLPVVSFTEFYLPLEKTNTYPQHPNCSVLPQITHDQLNKNVFFTTTPHTARTKFCSNMEDGHLNASSVSR